MATEILRPNATGDLSLLSIFPDTGEVNWEDVDEAVSDDDVTYVFRSAADLRNDLYNLPAYSGAGPITSITVHANCRSTIVADQTSMRILHKSHGTLRSDILRTLTTSYVDYSRIWATNVTTGKNWTWEEVDALQIGVRLRKPHTVNAGESRCTQVWVVITHTVLALQEAKWDFFTYG